MFAQRDPHRVSITPTEKFSFNLLDPNNPIDLPELFLVKNWKFPAQGRKDDPKYPYTNFLGATQPGYPPNSVVILYPRVKQVGGVWQYDWAIQPARPDVTDVAGVPGQNTTNPVSTFPNHCILRVNESFYDPSYGLTYGNKLTEHRLVELQNKAIAGFYKVAAVNNVRAMLIRKAPKATFDGEQTKNLQIQEARIDPLPD